MKKVKMKQATIAANANAYLNPASGAVVPPIETSTTFARHPDYSLPDLGFAYARDDNETVAQAEAMLAELEDAKQALLFPSGMAAHAAVFRTLPTGACVLVQSQIYWGTTKWVSEFCQRRGIAYHEVEASDADALAEKCRSLKPDLLLVETPSNPWLRLVDIAHAAACVQDHGGILLVDSTAATPVLSKPLAMGADIVMHSATKGLNGHSDVVSGALVSNATDTKIWQDIKTDRHDAGAILGPFESWLLQRGMRTVSVRMERASQNALAIAKFLNAHPKVEAVLYPGLPDHPGHALALKQMQGGFGCLLSFMVKDAAGSKNAALAVASRLQLFHRATSLGGVESLVEHRHTIEPHTGIPENLLRVSVGIEHIDDLIADLDQALTA